MTVGTLTDGEVFDAFPGVVLTHDNIAHYRGLLERKLLINRCDDCGFWSRPPRPLCPECWSRSVTPTAVSGKGTIFYYTVMYQGRELPGFEYPHLIAGVELAEQEGLRYLAPIVNVAHDDVREGLPVELVWLEDIPGGPVAAFQPSAS